MKRLGRVIMLNLFKKLFNPNPSSYKLENILNDELKQFKSNNKAADKHKENIANRKRKYMIAPGYVSPHPHHPDYKNITEIKTKCSYDEIND